MPDKNHARSSVEQSLERKIRLSRWALLFEQLWPRLWIIIALVALFLLVSLAGVWLVAENLAHKILLGAFGLGLLAALVPIARLRWPSRAAAVRRLEATSGVPHRPASSYEDQLSNETADAATAALWEAHRSWLKRLLARLRVGHPQPRVYRRDPFALRTLLMLGVILLLALAGDSASDRLAAAFRFEGGAATAEARLDAWITPPAYTGKPPVMLADGSRPAGAEPRVLEVPEKSILIVRSSGAAGAELALDVTEPGAGPRRVEARAARGSGDVAEIKLTITTPSQVRVTEPASLAAWDFVVIRDLPPKIALSKPIERTARGSMKLYYKVEDDYGVSTAAAKVAKVPAQAQDPSKAWARRELKGPRPPLERPPELNLRVPPGKAKDAEAHTYLEIGSHPWAGIEVLLTLEAQDIAGQTGRSTPARMLLSSRQFENPLARAVVEQRRKLVDDPRYRELVLKALDGLTLAPEGHIDDARVYLGLRSAFHRLLNDESRAGRNSVIEQLWHVAVRIEDGDLTDAERRLKDAQEKLSKALEDGAGDEEIKELMEELRQALSEYTEQLAKQAENQQGDMPEGTDPSSQMLSQQDLDRMMREIEDMAKNGSREQAQQMLSELRDLMERMQAGQQNKEQAEQSQEMMEMMSELGGMVGEQQELMDDTFEQQRKQEGAEGRPGQQGQKGQRGAQKGQKGQQQGKGEERGKQGQGEGGQDGQGQQSGPPKLGQRQAELRDRLNRLQKQMNEKKLGAPEQLDGARDAMEGAEQALERGDLGKATEQQARALDEMRQGAQAMAQQMLQNSPQRYGQSGDTPRDPLGRPQKSEGPDPGSSVDVPDAIDMQRAREILEELRRRVGEPQRPEAEIDYIERLLRRF